MTTVARADQRPRRMIYDTGVVMPAPGVLASAGEGELLSPPWPGSNTAGPLHNGPVLWERLHTDRRRAPSAYDENGADISN